MPTIAGKLTFKKLGETVPGELFRMNFSGASALCIHLETYEDAPIIAILDSAVLTNTPSFFRTSEYGQICISYGTGWVIEPLLGNESFPKNSYEESSAKILYLRDAYAIIRATPVGATNPINSVETDITGNGRQDVGLNSVPVRHWRIWASEEERNRPAARPVIEFGAPQEAL